MSRQIAFSAHKPIKDNITKFSTFLSDFINHCSPTTLKKNDLPDEQVRKLPVVTYLALNDPHHGAADNLKFIEKEAFLKQAIAIYEESVNTNPFLNTIVAPAVCRSTNPVQQQQVDEVPSRAARIIKTTSDDIIDVSSISSVTAADFLLDVNKEQYPLHNYVALGGTFDRLHPGHKMLLTQAALATAKKLRVGITGPKLLVNKKNAEMLQSFEDRCQAATDFLRTLRPDLDLEVVELEEKSGGTNAIAEVDAMVVSPETAPVLDVINKERQEKGFKDMAPVVIEFLGGDSNETRISSSKLRQIEINATSTSDEQQKKFE